MLMNRSWSITFHIVIAGDVDGWCQNWPVWSTPQTQPVSSVPSSRFSYSLLPLPTSHRIWNTQLNANWLAIPHRALPHHIFKIHMNILFIFKVKIPVLIKWPCKLHPIVLDRLALCWKAHGKPYTTVGFIVSLSQMYTPSVPKWLSYFLILARSRPAHHWASGCKYET